MLLQSLPTTTHLNVLKHQMHLFIPRGTTTYVVVLPTIDSNDQLVHQCAIFVRLKDISVESEGLKRNEEINQGMLLQCTILSYVLDLCVTAAFQNSLSHYMQYSKVLLPLQILAARTASSINRWQIYFNISHSMINV